MEKKNIMGGAYNSPELQVIDIQVEGALCDVASGDHENWGSTEI